jgi:hypothetical protein
VVGGAPDEAGNATPPRMPLAIADKPVIPVAPAPHLDGRRGQKAHQAGACRS